MGMSFNSRAHEGRDSTRFRNFAAPSGFNSRAHEGRDLWAAFVKLEGGVSIHAPTRGATSGLLPVRRAAR